jgi:hypothetical protein
MAYFNLPFSVRISNSEPIDGDRYIAVDIAQRDQLITDARAQVGQQVYVVSEKNLYILETLDPTSWTLVATSGSFELPSDIVSGSGQINYPDISNIPSGIVSSSDQLTSSLDLLYEEIASGTHTLVSGSSQLTSSYDLRYELQGNGIVSGSSQLTSSYDLRYLNTDGDNVVSGSSQIDVTQTTNFNTIEQYSDIAAETFINSIQVVSGSSQINYPDISNIPSGIVSSSFVAYTNVDNTFSVDQTITGSLFVSGSIGIGTANPTEKLSVAGNVSASAYIKAGGTDDDILLGDGTTTSLSGIVAGSGSQVEYDNILNKPTLVSGSDQVSGSFVQSYLDGEISGADNIINMVSISQSLYDAGTPNPKTFYVIVDSPDPADLYEEIASGTHTLVSGSSQLTSSYDTRYTLSGSISPLPNGIVSGSDQVSGSFVQSNLVGEPAGADQIFNMVSISQSLYDVSSPNPNTFYVIVDSPDPADLYEEIASGTHTLVSGSSQLTSSYDVRYTLSGSIPPLPDGVVSGSSQINYPDISNIPSGIVSGSSQVDYTLISNIPSGLVSESIEYSENLDVDSAAPEVVAIVPTSSYDGVFFDYIAKNGSNARAGMVMATYIGETVTFTDNSTLDIGNTSPVTMSVDILSGNLRLMTTTSTDNWVIKTLIRKI